MSGIHPKMREWLDRTALQREVREHLDYARAYAFSIKDRGLVCCDWFMTFRGKNPNYHSVFLWGLKQRKQYEGFYYLESREGMQELGFMDIIKAKCFLEKCLMEDLESGYELAETTLTNADRILIKHQKVQEISLNYVEGLLYEMGRHKDR